MTDSLPLRPSATLVFSAATKEVRVRSDRADVGFIGAGQLARMSAAPAIALDVRLAVLANRADDSAAQVIPDVTLGNPDDFDAVEPFAKRCNVLTFDHELVDTDLLERLELDGI